MDRSRLSKVAVGKEWPDGIVVQTTQRIRMLLAGWAMPVIAGLVFLIAVDAVRTNDTEIRNMILYWALSMGTIMIGFVLGKKA